MKQPHTLAGHTGQPHKPKPAKEGVCEILHLAVNKNLTDAKIHRLMSYLQRTFESDILYEKINKQ